MSGGQVAIKGFLLQTIVCLLDSLSKNDWVNIQVEPDDQSEKVDILWFYQNKEKAVQVKHSKNPIERYHVKNWSQELETSRIKDEYELIILGTITGNVKELGDFEGKVKLTYKNVDVEGLIDQACQKLSEYFYKKGFPDASPDGRKLIIKGLMSDIFLNSIKGKKLSRDEFEENLNNTINMIRLNMGPGIKLTKVREKVLRDSSPYKTIWLMVESAFTKYLKQTKRNYPGNSLLTYNDFIFREQILDWLIPESVWSEINDTEAFCLLFCVWGIDSGLGANSEQIKDYCNLNKLENPLIENLVQFLVKNLVPLNQMIFTRIFDEINNPNLNIIRDQILEISKNVLSGSLNFDNPKYFIGNTVIRTVFLTVIIRLADILSCTEEGLPINIITFRKLIDRESMEFFMKNRLRISISLDNSHQSTILQVETSDIFCFNISQKYFDLIEEEYKNSALLFVRYNVAQDKLRLVNFNLVRKQPVTPFIPEVIACDIDKPSAIETLVGKNLYDDSAVFIRELIQNSFDACNIRLQEEGGNYKREIKVKYNTSTNQFIITDNGVGMTKNEIKNNLLVSCSKGFRGISDNQNIISAFGIGFLTIFMISNNITVKTKSYLKSESETFTANIRTFAYPIEIFASKNANDRVGTTITVNLNEDFKLKEEDLGKWKPLKIEDFDIKIFYNDKLISEMNEEPGINEDPDLTYEKMVFEAENDDYKLTLNAYNLLRNGEFLTVCGNSFGRVEELPDGISTAPQLRKKVFNNFIPVVDKTGKHSPSYSGNNYRSFYSTLDAPLTLIIKSPKLVDLNITRNNFISSTKNDEFFKKVDLDVYKLLMKYYMRLKKVYKRKHLSSVTLIGQYSLAQAEFSSILTPAEFSQKKIVDPIALQIYYSISSNVECTYLNKQNHFESHNLEYSLKSNCPTLLLDDQYYLWYEREHNIPKQKIFTEVNNLMQKYFTEYRIFVNIKNNIKTSIQNGITLQNFLRISAKNSALLDVYPTIMKGPPLTLLSFKEGILPESTTEEITLYGSTKPICGLFPNLTSNGIGTNGSGGLTVFYNSLNEFPELTFFKEKLESYGKKIYVGQGTKRILNTKIDFVTFLKEELSIAPEFLNEKYIHEALLNPILATGTKYN